MRLFQTQMSDKEEKIGISWWIKHIIWFKLIKTLCYDKKIPKLSILWYIFEFLWYNNIALDLYQLELNALITKERSRLFEIYINFSKWLIRLEYIPLMNPYKIKWPAFNNPEIEKLRKKVQNLTKK